MEIIYRAIDGTEFSTMEECENYENHDLNIIMIDEYGCKTNFEDCILFKCLSIEAAKFFYERFENKYTLPWKHIEDVDTKCYFFNIDEWIEFPWQAAKTLIEIDESMEKV